MTFDERVSVLIPLGFTQRQTRFLVIVALHGGYCLLRQYLAFAGVRDGKNARVFFGALGIRDLARRSQYQPHRGHIYHLRASAFLTASAQRENPSHRHVSPAVIARKLMVLDYVLGIPHATWYATEDDKVAACTREFGVALGDLPRRIYASADPSARATTRYFNHKLPLYCTDDPVGLHFVYVVTDETGRGLAQFLHDHVRLLSALRSWRVVAICPRALDGLPACRTAFDRFVAATWPPASTEPLEDVRWFFSTRRRVEGGDLREVSVADLDRFLEARRRFDSTHIEALYGAWLAHGDQALRDVAARGGAGIAPAGQLILHALPSAYSQFGSLPGVC